MVKLVITNKDPNDDNDYLCLTFTDYSPKDEKIIDDFLAKEMQFSTKVMLPRIEESGYLSSLFFGTCLVYTYTCCKYQPPEISRLLKSIKCNAPKGWEIINSSGIKSPLKKVFRDPDALLKDLKID